MRRSERHGYLRLIAGEILGGRGPMKLRNEQSINYHTWAKWLRTVRQNPEVLLETPARETVTKKPAKAPKLAPPGALLGGLRRRSISALRLSKLIGVNWRSAFRLLSTLRTAMGQRDTLFRLSQIIERDDALLGGQTPWQAGAQCRGQHSGTDRL